MPPTRKGSLVSTTISGITVTFDGVGALSKEDLDAVAMKTENWFDEYYNDGSVSSSSNRQLRSVPYQQQQQHRRLVIASIRNMKSYVESITSKVSSDGKSNTITYAMDMNYTATNDALSPEKVALLPYEDPVANSDLTTNLRRSITPAFSNVDASVDVPKIIKPPTTAAKKDPSFPLWAIIAIAVGGSALCCSVFFLAMRSMNKDSDGSGYVDSRYGEGSLPPTQFNINVADDNISMIDDPTVAKLGSGDMSVGHYGDQRYVVEEDDDVSNYL